MKERIFIKLSENQEKHKATTATIHQKWREESLTESASAKQEADSVALAKADGSKPMDGRADGGKEPSLPFWGIHRELRPTQG